MSSIAIIPVLRQLIDVFDAVIRFFHDTVGLGWGLSIIALTVVVRTALLPLTVKQMRSMIRMQQLAPQIKALQEKYKDDKQRLQQETMKFYQENKVNPFASCLPLLAQFPVFISLFYMLRADLKEDICGAAIRAAEKNIVNTSCEQVDPGSAKFLFIPDLTNHATGAVLVVLIVLYVSSQLASTLVMSATMDKNQRYLMMGLPFLFVAFIINFPAGLIVYWITTNTWTIGQSLWAKGHREKMQAEQGGAAAVGVAAAAASPKSGGKKSAEPSNGAAAPAGGSAPPPPPRKKRKQRTGRRR